jgi:acyl-CoA synthetase (AMP-forming)/AMP-acid ligase II
MNLALFLEMAADAAGERTALVCDGKRWSYAELLAAARGACELIRDSGVHYVALLDESSEASVIALFGAALAGVPYSTTGWPTRIWPRCSIESSRRW